MSFREELVVITDIQGVVRVGDIGLVYNTWRGLGSQTREDLPVEILFEIYMILDENSPEAVEVLELIGQKRPSFNDMVEIWKMIPINQKRKLHVTILIKERACSFSEKLWANVWVFFLS